jgi:HK97 gp10 family phage protein
MSKTYPVSGLADLDKYLSALPKNMQKGAYRAGLTAAAAVVRDEARLRAPKQTGQMAKSIKSGSARQNQDGTFSIRVGLYDAKSGGNNDAYLGLFHEYGVRPHLIALTGKGEGRVAVRKAAEGTGTVQNGVMKIGDRYVSGVIHHPGHAAHPFMRPALDAKAEEAIKAFATRIRAFLENKTGFVAPMDEAA